VVIPTKNSEGTLENCLRSIKGQTYPNIEMVVVDNYSTDKTREVAQKYTRVFVKGPERSSQRNLGSKNAHGDYLFFVDSDMELAPKVVEECIWEAFKKKAHAIIVPEVSSGEGFWTKCKALERSCYIGDQSIEAARFFRRDVFFEVGGYDEELVGTEDWDLNQKISKAGYRIGRIDAVIKHNEGKLSLWKTMKKKYQYGKTLGKYKEKHPKEATQQFNIVRPAFIRNWKKLAKDPLNAAGLTILKTCEFGAAGIGYLNCNFFISKLKPQRISRPENEDNSTR
jgi:glycosyltransferase involved in cell wall biosynthesis